MKADIAIYGSHNAAVALAIDGKIELVLEVERFLDQKNCGLFFYYSANSGEYVLEEIAKYIEKEYGITEYENCIADYVMEKEKDIFPAKYYHHPGHHIEHAAGSLYQSPHKEALIFSFDGGGNDGYFNIYYGRKGSQIDLLEATGLDIGFAYMSFGDRLGDIRHEPLWLGNLVYPGKIMGLCAYGTARPDWGPYFIDYYLSGPEGPTYVERLEKLSEQINLPELATTRIEGEAGWDVAATSQRAFEIVFMRHAQRWLDRYPNLPVHMTGGCALNIILNTRLVKDVGRDVFVSPNPSDCGLAVGMLCNLLQPVEPVDITYAGLPVLDPDMLMTYCEQNVAKPYDKDELVNDLAIGKIVGVVRGKAEHGPRALGNRSILCNPGIEGMKDTLNAKVKNREYYRPFAPVVRLEDVNKYFEWDRESRWMSFCVPVRDEWKDKLQAIVHVDGTARVQTVTKEQNEWLYDLLTKFEAITGFGVLLNTSFNIAGKPILSSYRDAVNVYKNTELDALLLENYYLAK